jgi:hypothetical protein
MKIADIQCVHVLNEASNFAFGPSAISNLTDKIKKGIKELTSLEGRGRRQIETLAKNSFRQWKKNSHAFNSMGGQTYFNVARHFAFISLPNFEETPLIIADVVRDLSKIPVDEKRAIISFIKKNAANRRLLITKSPPVEIQASKKISDDAVLDFYRKLCSKIYLLYLAKETSQNANEKDIVNYDLNRARQIRDRKNTIKNNNRPKSSEGHSADNKVAPSANTTHKSQFSRPRQSAQPELPRNMNTDEAVDYMFKHLFSKFSDDEIDDIVSKIQDRLSEKGKPNIISRLSGINLAQENKNVSNTRKNEKKIYSGTRGHTKSVMRGLENLTRAVYDATKNT